MANGDVEYPNYEWHVTEVRRLQEQYGEDLEAGLVRLLAAADQG